MKQQQTIGAVARRSGVPARTIRFYESEGLIPAASRTQAGYRLDGQEDIRRLRLVRRARLLGLGLPQIKALVAMAFSAECGAYAREVGLLLGARRAEVERQIGDLQALCRQIDELAQQLRSIPQAAPAGQMVAARGVCPIIDEVADPRDYCHCATALPPPKAGAAMSGLWARIHAAPRTRPGSAGRLTVLGLIVPALLCLLCCLPLAALAGGLAISAAAAVVGSYRWAALLLGCAAVAAAAVAHRRRCAANCSIRQETTR